mgnify:FL=1
MLNVFQYTKDITEIIDLVQEQESWKAICPSPQKADMFREIINELGLGDKVQVLTISKFVADILALGEEINKVSKSQLLMDLWTLWKIKINNDYEKYRFCFDLFTEIRSYSLSSEIFVDLKDLIEEQYHEGITLFNAYFNSLEIVDEQRSYNLVGDLFGNSDLDMSYIFWGYDHLNANQIDMLKRMGEAVEVTVPIASNILTNCDNLDWPTWLTTQDYEDSTSDEKEIEVRAYEVPKGRISEYLEEINETRNSNIVHIDKTLSLQKINSLFFDKQNFKVSYELFNHATEDVFNHLNELFKQGKKLEANLFVDKISEISLKYLKENKLSEFKVSLTLKETIQKFIEQSELNENIEIGDLKCVKEILSLDLPRSSFVSLVDSDDLGIYERDFLLKNFTNGKNFLFVEQSSSASLQDSFKFSNELMSVLSAFGPLQSKKYEVLNLKNLLSSFFIKGGEIIFESGAFENSIEWDDILKDIKFDIIDITKSNRPNSLEEKKYTSQKIKRISATRVQSYIDCPRKYYLDYVNKLDIGARSKDIIGADIKGVVEHDVIENYVKDNSEWSDSKHLEIITESFENILETSGVTSTEIMKKSAEAEIVAYTTSTIKELLNAKKDLGLKLEFEVDISDFTDTASGRIDLLVDYNGKKYIFDFKRSSFGIPTKTDFEKYNKIQLWYYMKVLKDAGHEIGGFGYINLSELDTSLLYLCDEESILFEKLFSDCKVQKLKSTMEEALVSFSEVFNKIINDIENEEKYIPAPKNAMICSFCMAGPVCPKSDSEID